MTRLRIILKQKFSLDVREMLAEITVSYRQSRELIDLARAIIAAVRGEEQRVNLPAHVDSEGVAPVLLEGGTEDVSVSGWLANRICEIERFAGH